MNTLRREFRLRDLPLPVRLTFTSIVALIGVGYLISLLNIYHRHRLADGKPELTLDDMIITYHGKDVPAQGPGVSAPQSKMLSQVMPGGEMRKNLEKGGEPAIRALIGWLEAGAPESAFKSPSPSHPTDPTPEEVISSQCLRCHNADGGEKQDTPYGPDIFTVDYELVKLVALPSPVTASAPATASATKRVGPQSLSHLVLITHAHMLSIPIFTLVVFLLFQAADFPDRARAWIGPIPMLGLLFDFSGWWLARLHVAFVHMLSISGAMHGSALAIQLLAILYTLWLARPRPAAA